MTKVMADAVDLLLHKNFTAYYLESGEETGFGFFALKHLLHNVGITVSICIGFVQLIFSELQYLLQPNLV